MKAVSRVMPASRPHWVGNGFHVYPVFAQLAFTVAQEVSALRKARHEAAEGGGISPALERAGVCLLHTGLKVAAGLGLGVAVLWLFRRQIHSQTGGPELAGLFFIPLLVRRHTSPCV